MQRGLELPDLLAQGERTVEALARAAELGLTTDSPHLQTLKQANLIANRREGTKIYYRLAGADTAALYAWCARSPTSTARCRVSSAPRHLPGPAQRRDGVTREQLLARVRAGQATVIDVRTSEEYAAGHIPGAVSTPVEQLAERRAELPLDQEVGAYCRGADCLLTSQERPARRLADGMLEWRLGRPDLPVAT